MAQAGKQDHSQDPTHDHGHPRRAPAQALAAGVYTCPMHPEIRRQGPGHCPICGMALEPLIAGGGGQANPELRDFTRRFWIGLLLTLPIFVLEMGGHLFGWHPPFSAQAGNLVQAILATPVVLWAGWPFLVRAWESLRHRSANMFTLIGMGTGVAWLYSMVATFVPGAFSAGVPARGRGGGLFRGGRRHHRVGAAGAVAGAAGARAHLRRDPRLARPGAQDGGQAPARWRRAGGAAGRGGGGRCAARAPGRENPGRRRGHRGPQHGGRGHGQRRAGAGGQA